MSEDKGERSTLGGAGPEIIVKGGTVPSSYEKEREEQRKAALLGQEHQDKQMRAAAAGDQLTPDGFVSSKLHSLRMMDSGSPRLVLYYLNRDKTVRQECVSELVVTPDGDEVFTMICPRCLERGEPAARAQIMVRKSHRKWELDTREEGKFIMLVDPYGEPFSVRICGTVSCQDTLRCANFNCNWAVRVESRGGRTEVVEV
jgi:hypothetical protein